SCEDIGHKPQLLEGENADPDYTRAIAADWLKSWETDPDLAVDTRVAVPIYRDDRVSRFWCTLGVRPIKLEADYARRPSWRPMPAAGEQPQPWQELESYKVQKAEWVILGDDFAEVQKGARATLTRGELQKVCDQGGSKEEIIK